MTEPEQSVSRAQPMDLSSVMMDAVLKAPAAALPSVVGVDLGDPGYAVVKVDKVLGRDPTAADAARGASEVARAWADAESAAYYVALKQRYKVEIRASALAGTDPPAAGDGK
jgi:peptidyl-prolyl cis-trans isomerase D